MICTRGRRITLLVVAMLGVVPWAKVQAVVLLEENFEGLTLGPFVSSSETGGSGADWTDVPPNGWVRDNTTTPTGGPAEFFGFTFLSRDSWNATAGQERGDFSLSSGTVMVADGDEYDDDAGNGSVLGSDDMNVFIQTPAKPFNLAANSLNVTWANDFRAFDASRGTIEVSYDGGSTFTETIYDQSGADDRDTILSRPLSNPASGSLVLRFGYTEADNDWWWAVDNIRVSDDVILPVLDLAVDRNDGSLILTNRTGSPVNLAGYEISSSFGALDPASWISIADEYDADDGGEVDDTHLWSKLTDANVHGDLSEADLESGFGGTLEHTKSINLGNAGAWIRNPNEDDLVFRYTSDGQVVTGIVNFENAAPFAAGDINTDGVINALDWMELRSNQHVDLSAFSLAEAYRHGDLTGDGVNDYADFAAFKTAFDTANGAGSFAAMLSSQAVPEPTSVLLVLAYGLIVGAVVRQRRS